MNSNTHETARTQFVETNRIRYAYRRFGRYGSVPLLFLGYFNSNMDAWDPQITNGLAADQEVILFDNAGVGASGGETPHTVAEMTQHCVAFCRSLGLKAIDVVGFSLGGMIAQQLALDHPKLVRHLLLLGTGPRGGEGMTFTELSAEEQADPVAFLLGAFFSPSKASQAAGREYMKRLESRKEDRDLPVSRDSAVAQLAAIREWGAIPTISRYATLKQITHPALIVHGNKDIVVAPINALILAEHLPNAQLIVYCDSSHGSQYQHANTFLEHGKLFLSEGEVTGRAAVGSEALVSKNTLKKGLREQLIGAWRLVSYVESPVDGSPKRFPLGEKAEGIIMYTPDGYMSAQLMKPGRRPFASGDWFKGTPEEFVEEAAGYIAYSGPFHVDEERQALTHSMNVSLFPSWIGQTQPRIVKIEGNRLHLSTASPIQSGGGRVMANLIWERASSSDEIVPRAL